MESTSFKLLGSVLFSSWFIVFASFHLFIAEINLISTMGGESVRYTRPVVHLYNMRFFGVLVLFYILYMALGVYKKVIFGKRMYRWYSHPAYYMAGMIVLTTSLLISANATVVKSNDQSGPNLDLKNFCKCEQYLRHLSTRPIQAAAYVNVPPNYEGNVLEEVNQAEANGAFRFDDEGRSIEGPGGQPLHTISTTFAYHIIPNEEPNHFDRGSPPAMFGSTTKPPRMLVDGSDFDGGLLASVMPKKLHSPPPPTHRAMKRSETPPQAVIGPHRPETPLPPVKDDDDDFGDGMFSEAPYIALSPQTQPDIVPSRRLAPDITPEPKGIAVERR